MADHKPIENKRVLVLSTGDVNGAYEAAYRIAKFLYEAGYQTTMLVKKKTRPDKFIIEVKPFHLFGKKKIATGFLNFLSKRVQNTILGLFKIQTDPKYIFYAEEKSMYDSGKLILSQLDFKPDLVLACLTNDYVNTQTLVELKKFSNAEIVMVTMDMVPFTGGCHYAWDCKGYETGCSNCPAIIDEKYKNLAHENLMIKRKNIVKANLKILTGAGWALNQAKESFLFKEQKEILNINSCIDTNLFNNKNRSYAKNIFDLPQNSKVIFVGSQHINDERKGVLFAIEALRVLWNNLDIYLRDKVYIVVVGNLNDSSLTDQILFKKKYIEYIKDYRLLTLLYQASTIFLCSSIEDAGPMMVSEALACGTPVVGFEMGVTSNMVINGYNGFKAELRNSLQLAEGIKKILLLTDDEFKTYSDNAVLQVESYSSQHVVISAIEKLLNHIPDLKKNL